MHNAPTIDTKTGVLYMGTGSPAPTLLGEKRPGADLYTSSIIAIQASTGKMLWYHQEVPHNVYGYGAEQPVTIFNTTVNGKTVEAVAEAGKDGYLYILNAKTGKPLFAPVAVVKEEHSPPTRQGHGRVSRTGRCRRLLAAELRSRNRVGVRRGARSLRAGHDPRLPRASGAYVGSSAGSSACRLGGRPRGTFTAVNITDGKIAWQRQLTSPIFAGATATAGGIVFTGDQHGTIYAFDAKSGETLWQGNVGIAISTPIEIYTVDGQEYVLGSIGGSALTLGLQFGPVGSELVALKLGGSPLPGS